MRRTCCPPAPPPFNKFPNCAVTYTRACSDGTGVVEVVIPAAYFFVIQGENESAAAAQLRANERAQQLARGRALNQVLTCNTVSPEDLVDCGLIEERPVFNPACALTYCNGSGMPYCDGDEVNYTSVTPP